jgi:hypothetical protein
MRVFIPVDQVMRHFRFLINVFLKNIRLKSRLLLKHDPMTFGVMVQDMYRPFSHPRMATHFRYPARLVASNYVEIPRKPAYGK